MRSLRQPCMIALYLTQDLHDPGIWSGSADRCILENMFLRTNLSRRRWYQTSQRVCARKLLMYRNMITAKHAY